ncbi:phage baseplate assembly protein V [Dyella flagellata]|uniref:Gp5/Type VI secretion system Vgr protein OB-fold domain-containing protein n=1 Tax=Dyella flagellata TaxID=1867833 RepID=A0ABQ5XEG7_9GAMM|nr:phage baseplate assembly protein V [Dyella flagellata]GLQ89917.1 hypothetical protein GCM10007898_34920 [Dyella flagellata]
MSTMHGVVIGIVKEIDPTQARVKLDFPWKQPAQRSNWARIAAPMSGGKRGVYVMPELEDEALVAFDHGDFEQPYVVGFLWNGQDLPPADKREVRVIRSVNNHQIVIYDNPAQGADKGFIRIQDAHGNMVELANGQVTIKSVGKLQLNAPNVTINGRLVAPVGPPI